MAASTENNAAKPEKRPFSKPRTARTASTSKIARLPAQLRSELDRRINEADFHSLAELSNWLALHGYSISREALRRYRNQFDRQLDAVRLATDQARIVCEQFDGDDVSMQEALMRLVQTEMFDLLTGVNEAKLRGAGRNRRVKNPAINIASVARTVASLVKTSIAQQQWAAQVRSKVKEKVGAAAEKIDAAKEDGLSEGAAAKIKNALLDIQV